jgi:hypothetical protein
MKGFVFLYCSATRGETLALIPPVPRPIMIIEIMKPANVAVPFSIAAGIEVNVRIIKPTR